MTFEKNKHIVSPYKDGRRDICNYKSNFCLLCTTNTFQPPNIQCEHQYCESGKDGWTEELLLMYVFIISNSDSEAFLALSLVVSFILNLDE